MKLFVNLATLEVTPYVAGLADKYNGQHEQMTGHVIVGVQTRGAYTEFALLHPNTVASTGHVDVTVLYDYTKATVSFNHNGVSFELNHPVVERVFPTGGWSLLIVAVAVEKHLHREIGFGALLEKQVLCPVQRTL